MEIENIRNTKIPTAEVLSNWRAQNKGIERLSRKISCLVPSFSKLRFQSLHDLISSLYKAQNEVRWSNYNKWKRYEVMNAYNKDAFEVLNKRLAEMAKSLRGDPDALNNRIFYIRGAYDVWEYVFPKVPDFIFSLSKGDLLNIHAQKTNERFQLEELRVTFNSRFESSN